MCINLLLLHPFVNNSCSVDPYLFENFVTDDGDLLTARFKAFKFPDSNYILFRGTVNVCLGSCQGVRVVPFHHKITNVKLNDLAF